MDILGTISNVIDLSERIINYVQDVKDGKEDRKKLWAEVIELKALLAILQRRTGVSHGNIHTLSTPLQRCRDALVYLETKLRTAERKERKLIWPFTKTTIVDELTQIERLKSYTTLALQDRLTEMAEAIQNDLEEVGTGISAILANQKDLGLKADNKGRQELANWISSLSFNDQQDAAFGKHTDGTGTWILKSPEFTGWMDGKSSVLWCPGKPGVGKTIIASIVINHLRELFKSDDSTIVLFFYCNYNAQYIVLQLIEALVKQMALHGLTSDSIKSLEEGKTKGRRPSVDTLMSILQTEIKTYSRAFIVVDALDESPEQFQEDLLAKLRSLTTSSSAKLIATSRDIPAIERAICADVKLQIVADEGDIKSHVEARIASDGTLRRLVTRAPSMEEKVVKKVIEKAQGMFLLAQLHMNTLAGKSKRKDIDRALETLPQDFNGIYDEALKRVDNQPKDRKELAYRALSWISHAFRPLSFLELRCALAVEEDMTEMGEDDLDDEEILVSVCAGLVTVNEGSREVGLVHYTTQEYLQCVRDERPGFLSPVNLAISCFRYLYVDWLGTAVSDPVEEWMPMSTPFKEYAAQGWGEHSRSLDNRNIIDFGVKLLGDDDKVALIGNTILPSRWGRDQGASGLHLCSFFGLEHIAKSLVNRNKMARLRDCEGQTPLHYAARFGHGPMVTLLLEIDEDVNPRDESGQTPLSHAAACGHEGVALLMLEAGKVDVDARDGDGREPLSWAAGNGHEGVLKLLLEVGKVGVDTRDESGRTPLSWAARNGQDGMVKLLLETGKVDVDARDENGRTPLSWAAGNGRTEVVKLLLETGKVDVDGRDESSRTSLSWAAEIGHDEVVKLLLDTGKVDVDAKDRNGCTPLSWAAMNGQERLMKMLLEMGKVDVDPRDENGLTPLSWGAANGHEQVVKLLLETGKVDVDARDENGRTPLSLAAKNKHEEVVKLLLETGKVDADARDKNGRTPLSWAAGGRRPIVLWAFKNAVVKLLLETGKVDVDARDSDGRTPLSWAAENRNEGAVKLLLETGNVDVNAMDENGRTPLSWAGRDRRRGRVRGTLENGVVKLLLAMGGIDLDKRDETPFSWGAENGSEDVMKLLLGKVDADGWITVSQEAN